MRFLGNSEARLDAKGRVFLPSVFRKQTQMATGDCFILRKDIFQECLILYPEKVWNDQLNELRNRLNRWNAQHQTIFRQFVSDVEIITLDGNGQLMIYIDCPILKINISVHQSAKLGDTKPQLFYVEQIVQL